MAPASIPWPPEITVKIGAEEESEQEKKRRVIKKKTPPEITVKIGTEEESEQEKKGRVIKKKAIMVQAEDPKVDVTQPDPNSPFEETHIDPNWPEFFDPTPKSSSRCQVVSPEELSAVRSVLVREGAIDVINAALKGDGLTLRPIKELKKVSTQTTIKTTREAGSQPEAPPNAISIQPSTSHTIDVGGLYRLQLIAEPNIFKI